MNWRLGEILRGALAAATVATLILGVPITMLRFGGVPGGGIARVLTDELSSDNTKTEALLAGGLLLIAWLCWAQLAFALLNELCAVARGTVTRRATVLPGCQRLARRLVASSTLLIASVAPSATAIAAALAPLAEQAQPVDVFAMTPSTDAQPFQGATDDGSSASSAAKSVYVVQDRDTFWDLADQFLGDGLRWQELRAANIGSEMPDGTVITAATEALQLGWTLRLPADAAPPVGDAAPSTAPVAPEHQVALGSGDHFWQVATDALTAAWGRTPTDPEVAPYWADMVFANDTNLAVPGNPDLVYAGQHVLVPSAPADPAVGQPPPPPPPPPPPASVETQTTIEPSSPPPPPPITTAPVTPPTEAPTTSASVSSTALTPQPESVPATVEAATDDSSRAGDLIMGLGALASGAGALALTLRRLRRQQAVRRQPGTIQPPLPTATAVYERRTRAIADTEAARWLEAVNRYLTRQLANSTGGKLPALIAARAGALGVELLLDEPAPPPDGFIQDPTSDAAWRLDPSIELAALEATVDGHQPYCPALLPVGRTSAGELHLDIEQIGILAIAGPPDCAAGWFRTLAAAVASSGSAEHCTVVALNDGSGFDGLAGVTVPADPDAWVKQITGEMRRLNDRLDRTPYELRVSEGELFHPTIVFLSSDHGALARELVDAAALMNTPLAVIATVPLGLGSRLILTPTSAVLEPHGLDFAPALTTVDEATHVHALLTQAIAQPDQAAPSKPVPSHAPAMAAGPDSSRSAVAEVIERITRKRPVEVSILTPTPRVRGLGKEPTSKIGAVISYLAFHRTVSSQALREEFWPSSPNRSTADNALSQVRQLLGTAADGSHRLGIASNRGRYELSDEVGCDWTKLNALVEEAAGRPDPEVIEILRAALDLVGGRVTSALGRNFRWLTDDFEVYGTIERKVVDAAHRLGELALNSGNHALARWAAATGLGAVPGQEALFRLEMRAAGACGDLDGVRSAYRAAVQAAEALGSVE